MHGLILAGGEGSRLLADGVAAPKALVEVAGKPQVVRLMETFAGLGCESVTCMLHEAVPADGLAPPSVVPIAVVPCRTPSSLHTLAAGLALVGPGPVFAAMVDTVMPAAEWARVYREAASRLAQGADAVLAVTPHVDDERAVYVVRDAAGWIRSVGDAPIAPVVVTGGVYGFGPRARQLAAEAVADGLERVRALLQELVGRGYGVAAVEVAKIIDVDHESDLVAANAMLASPGP